MADNSCTASEAFPLHVYACPSGELPATPTGTSIAGVEDAQTQNPQHPAHRTELADVKVAADEREEREEDEKRGSDEQDDPNSAAQPPRPAVSAAPGPFANAPFATPAAALDVEPLQPADVTVESEPLLESHDGAPVPVVPTTVAPATLVNSALDAAAGMPQAFASAANASSADSKYRANGFRAGSAVVAEVDASRDSRDKAAAPPVHAPDATADSFAQAEAGEGTMLYGPLVSGTLLPAPMTWGWVCLVSMPPLAALTVVFMVYRRRGAAGSLRLCAAVDKSDAASGGGPQDDGADGAAAPQQGLHKGGRRKRTVAERRSEGAAAADAASEL